MSRPQKDTRSGEIDAAADASLPPRWHALSVRETLEAIGSGLKGLTSDEAARRLRRYGPNRIEPEKEDPWWLVFVRQLRDPLIYILLAAAAVTLALQEYVDAGVILAVVALNTVIGFVQELRAQQAMRALARLGAPRADVVRDGRTRRVPAEELVPGDVVLLTSGSRVPADLRLLEATDLVVDESALTGESVPVRKDPAHVLEGAPVPGDQANMAFAGTVVGRGRARGVVVRTGTHTEVGRIAEAVREVGVTETPLQEDVHRFGKRVGIALVVLALVALAAGLFHGLPPAEIFLAAVAMAVSAVPEGLPVVLTVTLAVGVRRMAERRAIVRKLPAVETLGSTTVIASDKTGTLTRNEMTVRRIWTADGSYEVSGAGYEPVGDFLLNGGSVSASERRPLRETLRAGVLANEADSGIVDDEGEPLGDPTEVALLVAAAKAALDPRAVRADHPRLDLLPFEPERRFMASLHGGDHEESDRVYLKGAPEVILRRCDRIVGPHGPVPLDDRDAVVDAAREMAGGGLRVLAMAYRPAGADGISAGELEGGLVLCGLEAMEDPVRPEAVESIRAVHRAGIRVVMLTGDHLVTARAIGRQLGIGGEAAEAVEGEALQALSDAELDELLDRGVEIFARVSPEHKLRMVQRLRERDDVVAVTGDGVNDAPALRAAHLGIAMGVSGTDVAREASDMVLADDNFATIRAAVEEGRIVFSNIRKVTFFLLSTAVGEVLAILAALFAGWPLPFVAAQILWINLVTNGLQDVALAVEPGEPGLLERRPRPRREGILNRRLLERLGIVGVVLAAGTLCVFWWTLETSGGDLDLARTMAMTQMVVFQFFHVFNCRSLDRSIVRIDPFSNRFLFASLVAALLAQLAVLYWGPFQTIFRTVPLDGAQWALLVAIGATVIAGGEVDKWWNRRRARPLG